MYYDVLVLISFCGKLGVFVIFVGMWMKVVVKCN